MKKRKTLFAVGTENPDPAQWKGWNEVELVLAEDKEHALRISGYGPGYPVVEVNMTKAGLVMKMPAWNDD